jgi:hypothetical protein
MPQPDKGLWPHLPSGTPQPVERRQGGSIADAVFPHLKPPQPVRSTPVPQQRTREWAMDWSHIDERFARLVGLVPKSK